MIHHLRPGSVIKDKREMAVGYAARDFDLITFFVDTAFYITI